MSLGCETKACPIPWHSFHSREASFVDTTSQTSSFVRQIVRRLVGFQEHRKRRQGVKRRRLRGMKGRKMSL